MGFAPALLPLVDLSDQGPGLVVAVAVWLCLNLLSLKNSLSVGNTLRMMIGGLIHKGV